MFDVEFDSVKIMLGAGSWNLIVGVGLIRGKIGI